MEKNKTGIGPWGWGQPLELALPYAPALPSLGKRLALFGVGVGPLGLGRPFLLGVGVGPSFSGSGLKKNEKNEKNEKMKKERNEK